MKYSRLYEPNLILVITKMSRLLLNAIIHSDDDDEEEDEDEEIQAQQLPTENQPEISENEASLTHQKINVEEQFPPLTDPISNELAKLKNLDTTVGQELSDLVRLKNSDLKMPIRFQPVGSTPLISPRVFKISATQTMASLSVFLRRRLKISDQLWLYLHSLFSPNPDERLGDLWEMFRTNDELVVYYCNTVAFG